MFELKETFRNRTRGWEVIFSSVLRKASSLTLKERGGGRQAARQAGRGLTPWGRDIESWNMGMGVRRGGRGGPEGWISAGVYGGISGWSRTMWGILSHIKYGRHRGTMVKTIVSSRGRGRSFFYSVSSSRAAMIYTFLFLFSIFFFPP